jgi:hypothetical protein
MFYTKNLNLSNKFILIIFFFFYNNFYSTQVNEMSIQQLKKYIKTTVDDAFKNNVTSFFYMTIKSFLKSFFQKIAETFLDWLINFIKSQKELAANSVNISDLDKSVVPLIFPLDVENNFSIFEQSIINNITIDKPLPNLLLEGPAGTGKTTGAERIAEKIEKEIKKMGNSSKLLGVIINKFSGGEIYGKGLEQANKFLKNKIEFWIKKSETHLVILILDEMEVLFPNRELLGNSGKNDIITLFLSFAGNSRRNFFMMAATNHADALDSAVRRRFNNFIPVKAPDLPTILKIMNSYIIYHGNNPYLSENFDIENNYIKLLYLSEIMLSMSGADIDNMVKKAVQESVAGLGFLHYSSLLKSTYDEVYKKATFSRKLSEDKKIEIKKILGIDSINTWFNYIVPIDILISCNVNYETYSNNNYQNVFYNLNNKIQLGIIDYLNINSMSCKNTGLNQIQTIQSLSYNQYIMNKYFNKNNNLTNSFVTEFINESIVKDISICQILSRSMIKKGIFIADIEIEKINVNKKNNKSLDKIIGHVYKNSQAIKIFEKEFNKNISLEVDKNNEIPVNIDNNPKSSKNIEDKLLVNNKIINNSIQNNPISIGAA